MLPRTAQEIKQEQVFLTVRIERDVYDRFREVVLQDDTTISAEVRRLIDQRIETAT